MFSSAGHLLNKTQLSKLEIFGTILKKTPPPLAQNVDLNPGTSPSKAFKKGRKKYLKHSILLFPGKKL